MATLELLQILIYFGLLLACAPAAPLLRGFMAGVFGGQTTYLTPALAPVERGIYALGGVNPDAEMGWKGYAAALANFNLLGFAVLFLLQMLQGVLPLNPADLPGVAPLLAFNTAISFVTNTNWQSYGGETTMSYLTQMLGSAVQNFLSADTDVPADMLLSSGSGLDPHISPAAARLQVERVARTRGNGSRRSRCVGRTTLGRFTIWPIGRGAGQCLAAESGAGSVTMTGYGRTST